MSWVASGCLLCLSTAAPSLAPYALRSWYAFIGGRAASVRCSRVQLFNIRGLITLLLGGLLVLITDYLTQPYCVFGELPAEAHWHAQV